MAINFIKMFKDGPEVSFNGSPTVSPITAALCSWDPFPIYSPVVKSFMCFPSINFLALSQAPPELA